LSTLRLTSLISASWRADSVERDLARDAKTARSNPEVLAVLLLAVRATLTAVKNSRKRPLSR